MSPCDWTAAVRCRAISQRSIVLSSGDWFQAMVLSNAVVLFDAELTGTIEADVADGLLDNDRVWYIAIKYMYNHMCCSTHSLWYDGHTNFLSRGLIIVLRRFLCFCASCKNVALILDSCDLVFMAVMSCYHLFRRFFVRISRWWCHQLLSTSAK